MKIDILGLKIDALTQAQVLDKVESFFIPDHQSPVTSHQLITANPEIVLESLKNSDYQNLINQSSLVLADGVGLLWAAKFLSLKSGHYLTSAIQAFVCGASLLIYPDYVKNIIPERITGVDLMEKISDQAGQKNWKIYLLGGEQGIAQKTAEVLRKKYLNLNIVGTESGPMINGNRAELDQSTLSKINQVGPDILFVAMGSPKQDFLIKQILPQLPSVKLAMGIGGAFDFISGKAKRAPLIYQDLGLEWLFRLFNQPWRFIRILNATIRFMWDVIKFKQLTK